MSEKVNHPSHYQSGEVEEDGTSKYESDHELDCDNLLRTNKMAEFNITDPEIIKMLDGITEEARQDVADQIQKSLDSGEIKRIVEEAKAKDDGNTPERVEEQIEWLKKKAAQKVIEQHSKAFEKLAENKE